MDRIAAIDIGSNSIRLLVAQTNGLEIKPICKELRTTRLGSGVDSSGLLSPRAMQATLEAVGRYKDKAISMGAADILVIATSAVRDAKNGESFIEKIRGMALDARILDGRQEAEMGFLGAVLGCKHSGGSVFIVDIGGGSTELVLGNNLKMKKRESLGLGAVRLTERFVRNDPIDMTEMVEMEQYIMGIVTRDAKDIRPKASNMIGIGGTITSLAAMDQGMEEYDSDRIHNYVLTRAVVKNLLKKLSGMNIRERQKIPGLQYGRADIIVAGALILKCLMEHWGFEKLTVSEWDNLEGVIYHNIISVH